LEQDDPRVSSTLETVESGPAANGTDGRGGTTPPAPESLGAGSRVASNAAIYTVGQLLSWCISFLSISLIPRFLGEAGMGQIAIATAGVGVVAGVVGFSVESFVMAEMGRRNEDQERVLRAVMGLRLATIPVMVFGALVLLAVRGATPMVWILGGITIAQAAATYLYSVLRSVLIGWEQAKLVSLLDLILVVFGLAAIPFVMLKVFGPPGYVAMGMAAVVTVTVAQWVIVRRRVNLRPAFDFPLWKRILTGSAAFYVVEVVHAVYAFTCIAVLQGYTDEANVGVYAQAMRLQGTFIFLPTAIGYAILPFISRLADADSEEFRVMQKRVLSVMIILGMPVATALYVLADPICLLLYGPNKFRDLPLVLQAVSFNIIPLYVSSTLYKFLVAKRKNAVWSLFMLGTTALNWAGCHLLIPIAVRRFGNGAVGVIASVVIAEVVTIVMALMVLRTNPVDGGMLVRIGKTVAACAIMAGAMLLLRGQFVLIPLIAGGAVFTALLFLFRLLGAEEQEKLVQLFATKFRRRFSRRADADAQ
jgi:O-antigen/teichoic acid export membrane protein